MTDFALIFQSLQREPVSGYNTKPMLVVTRHVLHPTEEGRPVIGAGKLLGPHDLQELGRLLEENAPQGEGWIERNLIYRDSNTMIWFVPGKVRPMHFRIPGRPPFVWGVHWPNLVFRVSDGRLTIAAYAKNGRPAPDTRLYHAPLWNVYESGSLCLGNATGGKGLSAESRRQWETAIFDSAFSHSNHDRVIRFRRGKRNKTRAYLSFIKEKSRSGAPFYSRDMVPIDCTLEEWAAT